ncbi:YihY/virulence factor BrkB family protein [Natronorarus salvus]|uniref:YihY/virulence factor BrkB family protein n=1 Tax=Natronorarus salvus TaxID=3117733 RepID=UPI002F26A4BD
MSTVSRTTAIGKNVVETAQDNDVTFLAASIAYYAFVSLIPLLLLTFVLAAVVGGEALAETMVDLTQDVLTPTGQDMLEEAIVGGAGRGGATVVGIGVLFWSALKLFRGIDTAFSMVYGADGDEGFLQEVSRAAISFLAIILAVVGLVVLGTVLAFLPEPPLFALASPLILVVALTVVFLPLYYFLPSVEMTLKGAVPGAVFAAAGWAALQSLFGLYAANAGQYDAYGAIGAVLLLFTWLYIGGIVILVGAIINAVVGETTHEEFTMPDQGEDTTLSDDGTEDERATSTAETGGPAPDVARLGRDVEDLRSELASFEGRVEQRTVTREEVESDLRRYVRRRMRRGHATGWGPYLVLLYGTAMTLGAFYFLAGGWAIAAMLVIWLSTLGLYVLMVIVGTGLNAVGYPGRLREAVRMWRGE